MPAVPAAEYDAVREAAEDDESPRALARRGAAMGERLKGEPWPR